MDLRCAEGVRTYLAKRRLAKALTQVQQDGSVQFSIRYYPYQLYPDASEEGEDKYEWYRRTRFADNEDSMRKYVLLMTAYGVDEGINYDFHGIVANTLNAHRLIQHYQETGGASVADALIESLYKQYFEEKKHPSAKATLLQAAADAGIDQKAAAAFIADEDEGRQDVKLLIREQAGNGIDSVPYVVFIGKRRDITLEGCREVHEYRKALEQIVKESA